MQQESMNPSASVGDGIPGQETLAGGISPPASDTTAHAAHPVAPTCPGATPDPVAHVRHAARFVIIGETHEGRRFRPSDWAERLAGVMAAFRPRKKSGARSGVGQFHLGYSPYVLPSMYQGFKCVIVDRRLHDVEPLAHNFVLNFALDNRLRTEALD